jgi:adenylate cyclase
MGDAVNLASRLEGINKQYGTRIILSEMTYAEVKDNFICREVDWVRVKGKVLPVKIFELMAEEKASASVAETLKWFREGYEHYHGKAWQNGLQSFSKVLDLNPTDSVAKLYVQRCQDYLLEPPEDGWDGVFVMKTK